MRNRHTAPILRFSALSFLDTTRMLKQWIFIILITLLISLSVSANPDRFVIGYVDHPRVISYYKVITEKAYRKLGIKVEFINVGSQRGLMLLEKGETDADVVRFRRVTEGFSNMIMIDLPLVIGNIKLYCLRGVNCDESILENPATVLATSITLLENFNHLFSDNRSASTMTFESQDQIIRLLKRGRLDYAILATDGEAIKELEDLSVETFDMTIAPAVHVIHRKHKHLSDDLSSALELTLNEHRLIQDK